MRINYRVLAILALLLGVNLSSFAATYWVSPSQKNGGRGTLSDPIGWPSFQNQLDRLGGGNTYVFLPGNYIGKQINLDERHSGTPKNPTIIKSQRKYKARFHGSPEHNLYVRKSCKWVVIDGFESSGAMITGIKSNADYTMIKNCWIHNNEVHGIEAHNVKGTYISNNLIEFNGSNIQFDHGVYADGDDLHIMGNVIRFNSAHGLHLYPDARDCTIENNLCYGNTRSGILIYTKGLLAKSDNKIVNNTIALNGYAFAFNNQRGNTISNNIVYKNDRWPFASEKIFNMSLTDLSKQTISNNIFWPKCSKVDKTNIFADPQFVEAYKGIFLLKKTSPARGRGKKEFLPGNDLVGNRRKDSDIGCFMYSEKMIDQWKSMGWFHDWPFAFNRDSIGHVDIWQLKEK